MKRFGPSCLLAAGAFAALLVTEPVSAAPRDGSFLSELRMPWSQQRKPARRAKRPAKPTSTTTARPTTPVPPTAPARAAPTKPTPPAPAVAAIAPVAALPPPPDVVDGEAAASGERAVEFVAIRFAPPPEAPPLAPLPRFDAPTEAPRVVGRPAPDAPLPPVRAPERTEVAMMPRAPLNGPPLPAPPDGDTPPPVVAPAPTARDRDPDCAALEREGAVTTALPPILGPMSCGAPLPVELSGVKLKDGRTIAIKPAAILRCETARAVAAYVRDDLAPAAAASGPALTEVRTAASYICRGRNNRRNAKMSEHGLANAVDLAGFGFADGREAEVYDETLPAAFAKAVRGSACARFMTVLGPGSDGFHEDHLHLDLRKRKNRNAKLCSWRGE